MPPLAGRRDRQPWSQDAPVRPYFGGSEVLAWIGGQVASIS